MKLYIIEDELLIMKYLVQIVKSVPYIELVGTSASVAKSALEIPMLKPDMILADIRLKDGNSFEIFEEIGIEEFQVIFLTAYDQYAIQALNMGAFGYLLKPIDEAELKKLLDKCFHHKELEKANQQQLVIAKEQYLANGISAMKRIALKSMEFIEVVPIDDIVYCKSDKGYTSFFIKNKKEIVVSKGLKEYEIILTAHGFLRCHQSYMVNFLYVDKYYKEGYLKLLDKESIPVSARKKEEVLRYLENIA